VKQLNALLPICGYCKKIRDDQDYWQSVEGYISKHTDATFSHGICPECFVKHVPAELQKLMAEKKAGKFEPPRRKSMNILIVDDNPDESETDGHATGGRRPRCGPGR